MNEIDIWKKSTYMFESKCIDFPYIRNKAVKSSYIRKSWSFNFQKTIDNTIQVYKIVVDFNVPVAQVDLELSPSKRMVTGSNPVGNANLIPL